MGAVVWAAVLVVIGGLLFLAFRWTRRPPSAPDLHRADEVQEQAPADAKTVWDKVRTYITIYGWKE